MSQSRDLWGELDHSLLLILLRMGGHSTLWNPLPPRPRPLLHRQSPPPQHPSLRYVVHHRAI